MTEIAEKKPVKKLSLKEMSWKGILTLASIGATLGAIIGKFL